MRAFLVSGRLAVGKAVTNRVRDLDLLGLRALERVTDFGFDLGVIMGCSEVMRRHPPHHLSPAQANHPAGQDPEARLSRLKFPQQRSN